MHYSAVRVLKRSDVRLENVVSTFTSVCRYVYNITYIVLYNMHSGVPIFAVSGRMYVSVDLYLREVSLSPAYAYKCIILSKLTYVYK